MKKLFLIDAYAIIYRAYYAFIRNPRFNSKGLNTSAIFGFINTLEDVLKREKPKIAEADARTVGTSLRARCGKCAYDY